MSVDAALFAKKAKKYYWFDRVGNIKQYWDESLNWSDEVVLELDEIYCKLTSIGIGVSGAEITKFLVANLNACYLGEDAPSSAQYCYELIKFVNKYIDDTFFIATTSGYMDVYDLMSKHGGEYEEETNESKSR